ncbi:MAG: hypothetical protein ACD_45C00751G0005 [uncultured bacterium]|nr:MAG: hypothetical protein ACD_45C00751G0005 [uncultured bacterium]
MVEINLLPWRFYVNAKKRQKCILLCGLMAGLFLIGVIVAHQHFLTVIEKKNLYLVDLQSQYAAKQNNKNVFSADMEQHNVNLLEQGHAVERKWFVLMNEVSHSSIYHLQLTKINYTAQQISIIGYGRSMVDLLRWIDDANQHLSHELDVHIVKVEQNQKLNSLKFFLIISQ